MNRGLLIAALLASLWCLPSGSVAGLPAEGPEELEQRILQLEEIGREKMLRGDSLWDDLMADGAYMVRWDGVVTTYRKGKALPSVPMKSLLLSDLVARVYGDVVVVTGLGTGEGEIPGGKLISFTSRYLNIWRKVAGTWKIVITQNTVVREPPKPDPPVKQ